jgi:hypothetical protein
MRSCICLILKVDLLDHETMKHVNCLAIRQEMVLLLMQQDWGFSQDQTNYPNQNLSIGALCSKGILSGFSET